MTDEDKKAMRNQRRIKAGESRDVVYGPEGIGGYSNWECEQHDKDILAEAFMRENSEAREVERQNLLDALEYSLDAFACGRPPAIKVELIQRLIALLSPTENT